MSYSLPSLSTVARAFVQLSYPVPRPVNPDSFPNSNYYGVGPLDVCFIISTLAVFGVAREIVRLHIMTPFANKYLFGSTSGWQSTLKRPKQNGNGYANGVSNGSANGHHYAVRKISAKNRVRERNVVRFAEQGWSLVYYTLWWCYGTYIHFSFPHSPWSLDNLWTGLPHFALAAPVKIYYLTQCTSWIHQLLILNAEARRKDHLQMNAHHVITICLVLASYATHLTRVGCLILVLMDWCDIVLAFAKMLRYLEFPVACDVAFVVFLLSWLGTRHIAYLLILYSTYYRFPILQPDNWKPGAGHYYTNVHWAIFNSLLGALQVLMCIWFITIVKVAWTVIRGNPAEDVRSDDEELPDSSDEEIEYEAPREKKSK